VPTTFYLRHGSTILKPAHAGATAWGGLLSLTGVNLVVLLLWNDQDAVDEQVMMDNFTTNITNTVERPWTLSTASVSHQNFVHFAGNMFALWLFGFPTYRVIGTIEFFKLYVLGGIACSSTHVLQNLLTGKTQPPLTKEERHRLEHMAEVRGIRSERELPPHVRERVVRADRQSLGASGSCMAVSAAAAALFPLDQVRMHPAHRFYMPLPVAVGLFVGSDLVGITAPEGAGGGDATDHAGHLGGLAFGALYAYRSWYSGRWGTSGQLPIVYRFRELMQRR
jgi:membrane associated rhomboid family serine protease